MGVLRLAVLHSFRKLAELESLYHPSARVSVFKRKTLRTNCSASMAVLTTSASRYGDAPGSTVLGEGFRELVRH